MEARFEELVMELWEWTQEPGADLGHAGTERAEKVYRGAEGL